MNKFIRNGHKMGLLMSLALLIAVFALLAMPQPATAAGTTELTVTKYAYDGSGVTVKRRLIITFWQTISK